MNDKIFCPNCDEQLYEEYDIVDEEYYFSCRQCGLEYFKEFDKDGSIVLEEI